VVLAEAGNADAQKQLAAGFSNGDPCKDDAAALFWYAKAAASGDLEGILNTAAHHEAGLGTDVDLPTACKWLEKAAKMGHVESAKRLALILWSSADMHAAGLCGGRWRHPVAAAVRWWRVAAGDGDAESMFHLGNRHLENDGRFPRNVQEGQKWLAKAAAAGHPEAPFNLALMFISGFLPANPPETYRLLDLAAERGDARAADDGLIADWKHMNARQARKERDEPSSGCAELDAFRDNRISSALNCSNPECSNVEQSGAQQYHKCSGCKRARYCCQACQKRHWKLVHKAECRVSKS
jgi:TPR repeat protein